MWIRVPFLLVTRKESLIIIRNSVTKGTYKVKDLITDEAENTN